MASPNLPPIDAHAHIAVDVTAPQVRRLQGALVFAVTRSLEEGRGVPHGCYPNIVWGLGVHPGDSNALAEYSGERFDALIDRFPLVGEIGLDRRAGGLARQLEVLHDVLRRVADRPVALSLHSTGCAGELLAALERYRVRAPVLHWFGGTPTEVDRAITLGSWFSVNGSMKAELLSRLPSDRVLTETDFPYTRRAGATRPGATERTEMTLASAWDCPVQEVRARLWDNLRNLTLAAGNASRLSRQLRSLLRIEESP